MIDFGISGHFRLEVRDGDNGELMEVREFDNFILDCGLDSYGGNTTNVSKCWVGTCDDPVEPEQERLICPLAWARHIYTYGSEPTTAPVAPDYVSSLTKRYRFERGVAAGELAEIGLSTNDDHNVALFFNRALILNDVGEPEPLTVYSNNTLDVYYTIRFHPPLTDSSGSFEFGGVVYNYTSRPAHILESGLGQGDAAINVGAGIVIRTLYSGGALGPITGEITGYSAKEGLNTYYSGGSPSASPYVKGTYYRDYTQLINLATGNFPNGIDGLLLGWHGTGNYYAPGGQFLYFTQIKLDKPIPKDSTNSFKLTFRVRWHRWVG